MDDMDRVVLLTTLNATKLVNKMKTGECSETYASTPLPTMIRTTEKSTLRQSCTPLGDNWHNLVSECRYQD